MSGIDPVSGFVPAIHAEILAEIETEELATIDAELDTSSDQPIGQINGIVAAKLAELWELLATAYYAFDEGSAEGVLLDNLAALTGTYREPAKRGTVVIDCDLTSGTVLPSTATVAKAGEPSNQWRIVAAYTAGYTGVHSLEFESTVTGVRLAPAGTLTEIVTPVSGWTLATNPADAIPGRERETDAELRLRRREELPAQGACNLPTLLASVLKVPEVQSAFVLENTSDATDANGLPPKSFHVMIWDGPLASAANADVWEAIYSNKPAGILAFGSVAGTIADGYGNTHTLAFDRLTQVDIWVNLILTVDSTYAGALAVKSAVLAYGLTLTGNADVIARKVLAAALSVEGVLDAPTCEIKVTGGAYAFANLSIGLREIAVFDSARITVTT